MGCKGLALIRKGAVRSAIAPRTLIKMQSERAVRNRFATKDDSTRTAFLRATIASQAKRGKASGQAHADGMTLLSLARSSVSPAGAAVPNG